MRKITTLILFFSVLTLLSCNQKQTDSEVKSENVLKAETFSNLALIDKEKCKTANFLETSFKIEYPDTYEADYFIDNSYYLRLQKFENNELTESIMFGTYSHTDFTQSSIDWLKEVETVFKNNLNLKTDYIGKKKIGNDTLTILTGSINYDNLNVPDITGNYNLVVLVVENPFNKYDGLNVTFTRKVEEPEISSSLNEEELKIWNTFSFLE